MCPTSLITDGAHGSNETTTGIMSKLIICKETQRRNKHKWYQHIKINNVIYIIAGFITCVCYSCTISNQTI